MMKKSHYSLIIIKNKHIGIANINFSSNFAQRQIFTKAHEMSLVKYWLRCSNMGHGLKQKALRRLTFESAQKVLAEDLIKKEWYNVFQIRPSLWPNDCQSLWLMTNVKVIIDKHDFTDKCLT